MRLAVLFAAVLCLLAPAAPAQLIRVPQDQPTIQAAINAAPSGASILVAPGTYTESLTIVSKVLTLSSSDGQDATIIQNSSGRALVISANSVVNLRGFTITAASAGAPSGLRSNDSTLAVRDCTFEACTAPIGGAAQIVGGAASFSRCRFTGNSASNYGGAIAVSNNGALTVHSCTFLQNSSGTAGGAIDRQSGTATIANSLVVQNSSTFGGGISTATPGLQVTNCTFAGNTITTGVGQAIVFGGTGTDVATVVGSIFRGNLGGNSGPIAATGGPSTTFDVTYSNVQGGFPGTGNIDADPMFVSIGVPGDYRLQPGSPCIDAGSNAALPVDILDDDGDGNVSEPLPIDLAFAPRRSDDPGTPDTGEGAAPIVDMGPYEFAGASPCRADFNDDGVVNSNDISAFLTDWLQAVTNGCF